MDGHPLHGGAFGVAGTVTPLTDLWVKGRPAARAHARRAEAGRATSAALALHDQPGGDGAGFG